MTNDAPSGLGGNAQMDAIDGLLVQAPRSGSIAGIAVGSVPVWNGSAWVKPSGTPDGTKFLRDDGAWATFSAARVFRSTNQAIASGASQAIAFDSERFDNDAIHDPATNNTRLTCKTAGKYLITGTLRYAVTGAGTFRQTSIKLNGTFIIASDLRLPSAAQDIDVTITTVWDLAVNEYVEFIAAQDSGGPLNILSLAGFSPEFAMVRVA